MKTVEQKYLEKAVINLTVENAKLKEEVQELETSKSQYWEWYKEANKKAEELEVKNENVVARIENITGLKQE